MQFLRFVDCDKKTGFDIAALILNTLEAHGIEISDCRGQGYDNMSGSIKVLKPMYFDPIHWLFFHRVHVIVYKLVWLTCCRMLSSGPNIPWYGPKIVQPFQQ